VVRERGKQGVAFDEERKRVFKDGVSRYDCKGYGRMGQVSR
jgi:hypothetical protein